MAFGPRQAAAQDRAHTWAGVTVQDTILAIGTTPSAFPCARNYVKLFACIMSFKGIESLKGLSELIYINWLTQCLTQGER